MDLKLKIYFTDEEGDKFMGAGVLWLLQGIRRHGSIRKAAEEMRLSYTKAHTMMKKLEDALGEPVLDRRRGGDSRDGALLTDYGVAFTEAYAAFQDQLKKDGEERFEAFLEALRKKLPNFHGGKPQADITDRDNLYDLMES